MLNLLLADAGAGSQWWLYVVLLVAVVVLLILPMFTQRKRNKEFGEMVNGLAVGDEVRTIGGIIGKITKINKEGDFVKSIIVESGATGSKQTLELDVTCIAYILNQANPPKQEQEVKTQESEVKTAEEPAKTEVKTEEKPAKKTAAKKTSKK